MMGCSDAISGGAYLDAGGKKYLLSGTIARPGFVDGNALGDLWNQGDTDVLVEWQDAADRLCPDGA
ncbi:hypothetical protein DVK44_16760 [Streptomyces paludis]|uniref:Uncharacterized protein n=1 Tax=Streptomyces paludis TaxID=2282738 RepID=A0A345HQU0_9ACTN|nr:hypothetical protein DVK44_16760 [Streptomyces paludis]